jgi:hypothetical protein
MNKIHGKPKPSRAEDMKKSRARKRKEGLVHLRAWVMPEEKEAILAALNDIRANESKSNKNRRGL